jgi:hypothetical protein
MRTRPNIFLRDYRAGRHRYGLYAVLDELTQTYDVVRRDPEGHERALRRHVLSLRDARRWASDFDESVPH